MYKKIFSSCMMATVLVGAAFAQDKEGTIAIGARGGITHYVGDGFDSAKQRLFGSLYGEYYLSDAFSVETAFNVGRLAGETGNQDFSTHATGLSLLARLALFSSESIRPYLTGGAEYLGLDPKSSSNLGFDRNAFASPVGGGLSLNIADNTSLDLRALYHYTFKDRVDGLKSGSEDSFISATAGLTRLFGGNPDNDGDGLLNKDEKARGTNPKIADTDGDGLMDGEEALTYRTDPLKADSDGDKLSDSDEIKKHSTNPNKADSDDDMLNDGDELMKYLSNPMKPDSDGDGLSDGDEVTKHKTDLMKNDTDGDGLQDGLEVNQHKTNPMNADSDGGTINDGAEVARGTNPSDADDDVAKQEAMPAMETLKVEVGKAIVLEGVVFKSSSAAISPESGELLSKAYNTLNENSEIEVEIQGHTDNTGSRAANIKLSQARADAVKAFLVNKGIAANRMSAKGMGPDNPIADNTTLEGRQKNRRIEFARTK